MLSFFSSQKTIAQESPFKLGVVSIAPIEKIYTHLIKKEMALKEGEIISNVLKVYNNSLVPIEFKLDITKPKYWSSLDEQNKIYTATPRDTLIIPIILVPYKLNKGRGDVIINVFLLDTDRQQIANNFFTLRTKKTVSWNINLKSENKLYFKNDETSKKLSYSITNTGNSKQDLFVSYKTLKGNLNITDTLKHIIKNPNLTLNLNADESATFDYLISEIDQKNRNVKKVSLDSYIPNGNLDYKKHSLFINTSQTKVLEKNAQRKDLKVDFIKLPNLVVAENYGYPSLPLTLELNAQNILENNAFMSINLRGFKQINERASLAYYTQLNYNKAYFSSDPFNNATWYVGYYDDVKTIEVGQISANIMGLSSSGNGLKLSYKYLRNHKTSIFYLNNNRNTITNTKSFGINHTYKPLENFKIIATMGRNERAFKNRNTTIFSLQPSLNFLKKHYLTLTTALSLRTDDLIQNTIHGYLFGATYNANFLKKQLKVSLNTRYNDKYFGLGSFERLNFNHRSSFIINPKWSVNVNNFYQNVSLFNLNTNSDPTRQEILFNSAIFNTTNKSGNLQPGIFYEYSNYPLNKLISRGVSFRISKFDFSQNVFSAINIKAGYSHPLETSENKDYFTFQFSTLLRYKVWNFNTKYNYGFITSTNTFTQSNNNITPQSLRLSLQNQYAFKNRHLLLDTNMVYSYINVFKNHSIGVFPTLYYFTDSGWRFSLNSSYSFSTRNFTNTFINPFNTSSNNILNTGPTINSDFTLGFSLKKDFGVPIPFLEKNAATITIQSFYDLDGNGIKNINEEASIGNVVVKVGKYEVITNKNGKAVLKNIPIKKHSFKVIPLEKLDGWFPKVNDSIIIDNDGIATIPFVRGVKIYGDIILDRQKIAIVDDKEIDLSRIKISAFNNNKVYNTLTDKKGRFEFYLPNGNYIITMDENVLGNTYKIARNNIPVSLKKTQNGIYVSFYVIENRRKVIIKDFNKKN
ncbi:MAG: hypothetical protein L3J45_00710 [Flavobacteriaceae bacterium]|nr:hypothetical protein [Flavobacteriaceae bacterium]